MKNIYLLMAAVAIGTAAATAQVVTTSPALVQTDSRDIVITFHADRGNKGLAGLGASTPVYAHTGVITSTSTSDSDWKYAPTWGNNSAKYQLTWVADNTWTLTIPDINEYYGVPAGVTVKKLAFVFRNANSSREGKEDDGGDIFINVLPPGFQMELTSDLDAKILTGDFPVTFTVTTTQNADIELYYDTEDNMIATAQNSSTLTGTAEFTASGTYNVVARATAAGQTISQTMQIVRVGDSEEETYPGGTPRMGAVTNSDGSVTFCIAAPNKVSAILVGSWNNYEISSAGVMNTHTDPATGTPYFWTTVKGLQPGTDYIYYYLIDGEKAVGDPYATLVLDPWNDRYISSDVFPDMPVYPSSVVSGTPVAIYNSDMNSYDWQVTDFKGVPQSDLTIYELLIRDFTGTEGQARGNGTIAGVLSRLDYLADLGVNAIELLPIMEFNGNNSWGYNTNFYFAPDKAYGTPSDYKQLIDEIHKRGMAVILDIVFNQSDGLHPWYMMYDIASNPFYNGTAPHAYSVLNDWNQDNPLVQQQWRDALVYWMKEYKVDGFRFDLVKGLGNNDSYNATFNPVNNTWSGVTDAKTNAYNATRVERMKELHAAMKAYRPDAYFINENLAGAKEENEMAADGEINWANINEASCQFAMGYSSNSSLNRFYAPLDSRTWGSTVSYAESHDEERMAYKQSKWGVEGVKGNIPTSMRRLGSVAAQMLLTPGAHMIWQFQEFGADQTTKDSGGGNNTSPKRVIWNYLDNENRYGLMRNYAELCHLRANNPELFREDVATSVNCSTWSQRTISLTSGNKEMYLVVNPAVTEPSTIALPVDVTSPRYKLLSCSYGTTPEPTATGVTLAAGAYAVYGTADIDGVRDAIDTSTPAAVIYGVRGAIIVEGDHDFVQAYTLAGTPVPMTGLEPGVYIVRADSTVAKVVVH